MTDPSPLFGAETEYAVAGHRNRCQMPLGRPFLETAVREFARLPDERGSGVFLANGQRFYVDAGDHPELATAEVTNPYDLLDQIRQGEALMIHLAGLVEAAGIATDVAVFRTSVDNGPVDDPRPVTWGNHENYLVTRTPADHVVWLAGHLASRVIYSGAGGWQARGRDLEFTLSPRAGFLTCLTSEGSTANRPLIHLRDERHNGRGWHRMHLICGESLCGEVPIVLRYGVTALILKCLDLGLTPGKNASLMDPVAAIAAFAADPSCRVTARLDDGRSIDALGIQAQYLAMVDTGAARGWLPPWAADVIALWRETLTMLREGREAVAPVLDWAMKLELFDRWSAAETPGLAPWLGGPRPPAGILQEIDLRFGQLGPNGIHQRLDTRGLCRRLVARTAPSAPIGQPPSDTRARVRGEAVAELNDSEASWTYAFCDWNRVVDARRHRILDMSDPFTTTAEWRELGTRPGTPPVERRLAFARPSREVL